MADLSARYCKMRPASKPGFFFEETTMPNPYNAIGGQSYRRTSGGGTAKWQRLRCLAHDLQRLVNISARRAEIRNARAQGKLAFDRRIGKIRFTTALDRVHDARVQLIKLGIQPAETSSGSRT